MVPPSIMSKALYKVDQPIEGGGRGESKKTPYQGRMLLDPMQKSQTQDVLNYIPKSRLSKIA